MSGRARSIRVPTYAYDSLVWDKNSFPSPLIQLKDTRGQRIQRPNHLRQRRRHQQCKRSPSNQGNSHLRITSTRHNPTITQLQSPRRELPKNRSQFPLPQHKQQATSSRARVSQRNNHHIQRAHQKRPPRPNQAPQDEPRRRKQQLPTPLYKTRSRCHSSQHSTPRST